MSRTVLIVDDSVAITRQIAKTLESYGNYEVIACAENGSSGVKLYQQLKPDLVLLDIVMPVMSGLEALRAILQLDPKARVVMISSVGGIARKVEEALRLGARNVITKPFDPEIVRSILDGLVGGIDP